VIFLARPLRDKCSSVPKGAQQSRARLGVGNTEFCEFGNQGQY
jgi:hypothetical protein